MNLASPCKRWKIWLLLCGIFLMGLFCGAVVMAGVAGKAAVKTLSMEGWSNRTVRDIKRDLKLPPEQEAKVRVAVEECQPRMMAVRDETLHKLHREWKHLQAKIMPLLTPEQAARWKEISARREAFFKRTFKLGNLNGSATNSPATNSPAAGQ